MARMKELSKDERKKKEIKRLTDIYRNVEENRKKNAQGLIEEAAYMRVTLEEYKKDLDENGYTEWFTQSEKTAPYQRERPVARLYNTMNKNYQSIMKLLSDLLPKAEAKPTDDGFDNYVNGRDDA